MPYKVNTMCFRSALNFVEFQHKVSNVIGNRRIENRMRRICRDTWRWRPRHRISLWPSVRSQWIATLPRNARRRWRRRYGGAFVAMAPSPSYQPVALRSVAMDCDPPAQRTTTMASSLRVRFRGDGALAIVSACRQMPKWPNAIANRKIGNRKFSVASWTRRYGIIVRNIIGGAS